MTCLPCAKEIINNGARATMESVHKMAENIPGLVKSGRLSVDNAKALYEEAISMDQWYCDHGRDLFEKYVEMTEPPWHGMTPDPKGDD